MDPAFLEFMRQSVIVEPWVSDDEYASPEYGPSFELSQVRVKTERQILGETARGGPLGHTQQQISNYTMHVPGDGGGLKRKDRVTVPDGERVIVMQINRYPDESGEIHHTRAFLGVEGQ